MIDVMHFNNTCPDCGAKLLGKKPITNQTLGLSDGGRMTLGDNVVYDYRLGAQGPGMHAPQNIMWAAARNKAVISDPIIYSHARLYGSPTTIPVGSTTPSALAALKQMPMPTMNWSQMALGQATKSGMVKLAMPAWMRRLPSLSESSLGRLGLNVGDVAKFPNPRQLFTRFVDPSIVAKSSNPTSTAQNLVWRGLTRAEGDPAADAARKVFGRRMGMQASPSLESDLKFMERAAYKHIRPPRVLTETLTGWRALIPKKLSIRNTWTGVGGNNVLSGSYSPSAHRIMMQHTPVHGGMSTQAKAALGHEMGHAMQYQTPANGTVLHRNLANRLLPTIAPKAADKHMLRILDEAGGHFLGTGVDRATLKLPQVMAKARFPKTYASWKNALDPRMSPYLRDRLLSTRAHLLLNYNVPSEGMPLLERLRALL